MKFERVSDRLKFGRKMIARPDAWIKGPGSHIKGTGCIITWTGTRLDVHTDEDGNRVDGQIYGAGVNYNQQAEAWTYLHRAVQKITGDESMHSARFNDDPNTTVEDVLEAFDVAIELAEKDEGLEPA
jgi:hypothetical protein